MSYIPPEYRSDPRDPFCSSVSVQERMPLIKNFTADDCINAMAYTKMLQPSIRKALIKRLDRLNREKAKS